MTSASKVALAFVVAALAVGFVSVAAPTARAASVPISLYGAASSGWGTSSTTESNPGPTLTVAQGDSVTITLHSTDGVEHQFFIDYNNNGRFDSGEPESPTFTSTTSFTFTASQAGTFNYYCFFHPGSMKGTFVVQGTGASTGGGMTNTLLIVGIIIVVVVVIGIAVLVARRRSKQP